MRRIKAIYLIPVFLVLLIGAAAAAYYFLFKPQLELVDKARKDWDAARAGCVQEEGPGDTLYQQAYDDKKKYALQIVTDYFKFQKIQQSMPAIFDMKDLYTGKTKEGIYRWYKIMGTGQMIAELNRWARSFHLPKPPSFDGTYTATLGYEDSLPSAKIVMVDFPDDQQYMVRGFGNLTNAIRRTVGHGYFPLIMHLPDPIVIQVGDRMDPRHDPKNPIYQLNYKVTGYFMTRGWDPLGATAATEIKNTYLPMAANDPPKAKKHRIGWSDPKGAMTECPPVLWFIAQPGLHE